jgi:hypothetical protein
VPRLLKERGHWDAQQIRDRLQVGNIERDLAGEPAGHVGLGPAEAHGGLSAGQPLAGEMGANLCRDVMRERGPFGRSSHALSV